MQHSLLRLIKLHHPPTRVQIHYTPLFKRPGFGSSGSLELFEMADSVFEEVSKEFALTDEVIEHHAAVAFFQGLPRWTGPMPRLNPEVDYILGLAFAAVIPVLAFVIVLLTLFTLMIVRFTCLANQEDRKRAMHRKSQNKLRYLIPSSILLHLFVVCLALAVVGGIVISESTLNVSNSVNALLVDIQKTGLSLMDFALWLKNQFISFDPTSLEDGTDGGEFLATAFGTLRDYIPPRFPDIAPLRNALADLLQSIMNIVSMISDYVEWVFTGIVVVTVLTFASLVFLLTESMFKGPCIGCRVVLFTLCLLIPVVLSWTFFATWTGVGMVLANGCEMVQDYRSYLRTGVLQNETRNLLIDSGLVCPSGSDAEDLEDQIMSTSDSILENPLAADTITLLLNVNGSQLGESTEWAAGEIVQYINCEILVRFSGRLESLTCAARQTSMLSGFLILWVANLLLAVSLSILFILALFGIPVLRVFAVWELPEISGEFLTSEGANSEIASKSTELAKEPQSDIDDGEY